MYTNRVLATPATKREIVDSLQNQLCKGVEAHAHDPFSSGCHALDACAGFRRGMLVEWLGEEGSGATTLALLAARQACGSEQTLVIVDRHRRIYPPALAARGIDLRRVVLACPTTERDQQWTLNQALRCPAIAAVLGWAERLNGQAYRRLQLSAESGPTLGFLVRGMSALREPSWADVRLRVQSIPTEGERRFKIEVLRARGGLGGQVVEVEISEEGLLRDAHPLHSVSELAAATAHQRPTRAKAPGGGGV